MFLHAGKELRSMSEIQPDGIERAVPASLHSEARAAPTLSF